MGIVFALLCALTFGLNNLMVKKGMALTPTSDNGYFITVVMNVIILGVAYGVHLLFVTQASAFNWMAILVFALSGFLTSGLGRFTFYTTIEYLGPSRAAALKNGSPIFTVIFALIVLHETVSFRSGSGIFFILLGIGLLGWNSFRIFTGKAGKLGYYLGITSAVFFGVGQAVRKDGLTIMDDAFLGAWVGVIAALLFLVIYEYSRGSLPQIVKENVALIHNPYYVCAGFLNSVGPLFFFLGVGYTSVSIVSSVAAIEPLLTIIMSRFLIRKLEKLSWVIWVASSFVFMGTAVILF